MKARDASASKNNDDYKGESEGQQDHSQDQAECCCVEKGEASFIFIQRTNIETHLWNAFQSVFLQSVPASKLCEFISIDINAGYEGRPPETSGKNAFIFGLLKVLSNFLNNFNRGEIP